MGDRQDLDGESFDRPLSGLRVLDLTMALAGPYCTLLLAGMGAEVINIEGPGKGDLARSNPPFYGEDGFHFDAMREQDISVFVLSRARNKKSVTLDLKSERGRELFLDLVATADVVVENMSDGTAERLGVGYEAVRSVNDRIVYASIAGFGEINQIPGLKAMDIIVQAYSGVMDVTGEADGSPMRFGLPIADLLAPLYACNGILAAIIRRGITGRGQHVKVNMLDCLVSLLAAEHFDVLKRSGVRIRTGNHLIRNAPFGVFTTSDGNVAIVATADEWLNALTVAMGKPELATDPRFSARGARASNADALNAEIEAWTRTLTSEEVTEELLGRRGIPCARVRTVDEVLHDPMMQASGAIQTLSHPRFGPIEAVGMGMPINFSEATAAFDVPAEELGASNRDVFGKILGLSDDEIRALKASRVI